MSVILRKNSTLRYMQLKSILLDEITSKFSDNDRFYTQRKLMDKYQLGYATVNQALSLLVEEGFLKREIGRGTFVRKRKTPSVTSIAVIVYHVDDPFYGKIIKSIEQEACRRGYNIVICNTMGSRELEVEYVKSILKEGKASGFAICPRDKHLSSEMFIHITGRNVPCVIFPTVDPGLALKFDYVISNYHKGAVKATSHLLEKGCEKIAFVSHASERNYMVNQKLLGCMEAHQKFGKVFDSSLWINAGDSEPEGGSCAAKQLLDLPQLPDGIFVGGDGMAIGLMRTLKEAGIRIGEEIKVIGFGDIDWASWPEFSLSTIRQPRTEIGRLAAGILIDRCEGIIPEKNKIILDSELVIRQSTGG